MMTSLRNLPRVLAVLGSLWSSTASFAQAPPAVPALPDTERRTSYSLSSSTCPACSVGFALYGDSTDYDSWIEVWLITGSGSTTAATQLTAVTDFTLSSATGPLATISRPITDATITLTSARTGTLQIVGARRPRRTTQFAENRGVAARDLNQALTDIIASNRETWDRTKDVSARALLAAPGDTVGLLPATAVRVGGILGFNSSGNPIILAAGSSGTANVVGPNVSVVGHIATFGNTTGTILLDGGLIGAGDFVGPGSSTVNHAVTFAGSTGKVGKDSGLTITPSTGTFTLTNGKTLAVDNTLEFAGTDSTVMTFPTASDTIVGRASTDTLTNKTYDTASTGNVFKINGTTVSSVTGIGPTAVMQNTPTLTTPVLGVATATSINKVAITAPATSATLTIADGKTLTDTSGIGAIVLLGTTGGGFAGYGGVTCTNQFIRALSSAAVATCASVANADLINSTVTIGSTSILLGTTAATLAGLTLTAPTINGGTHTAITNLGIRSSGTGAFDLTLANSENLTAARTLTLTVNNAARTLSMSGNITTAADFITAGGNAITLTTTGSTGVTLPTSGTLATINTSQTFSGSNVFSAVQQFTDVKFSSGKIFPTADSTTSLQVTKADGTTRVMDFDTSNARVGINKTPGAFDLDVNGAVNIGGALTFPTSTITGLTANNSPSSVNDYLLYYSAADSAIRKCTVGACAAAATAGVSSLNGLTGGLSIAQGTGISVSAGGSSVTVALTTARQTLPTVQSLTSGSAATYTTPANALWLEVYACGAGGGGGGAGASAAGTGGTGGTTTFNSVNAIGGSGGTGGNTGTGSDGGVGGTGGTGTATRRQDGNGGQAGTGGGTGGGSGAGYFGAGTKGRSSGGAGLTPTANSCAGGGGANEGGASAGGGGGAGEFTYTVINSPSATYTYTIGAGGTAGAAGVSGDLGGVGGTGYVFVVEHYGT